MIVSGEVDSPAMRVRRAADQIRALAQNAQLALAYAIGEVVIETLYDGDLSAWRSRGRKETSLRALVARLKRIDSISAPTLFRSIATYELLRDRGGVAGWKHVSITHVRTVLPLRNAEREIALLQRAERGGWSVRRLERTVKQARGRGARADAKSNVRELADRIERDSAALLERLQSDSPRGRGARRQVFAALLRAREALEAAQPLTNPKRGG